MKNKYWIPLMILAAILALSSCQETATSPSETSTTTSEQTKTTSEPATDVTEAQTRAGEENSEEATTPDDGTLSTPNYEIKVIDGKCYLNFTLGNESETDSQPSGGNDTSTVLENFIRFSSLGEMKQSLENLKLTEKQMSIIKKHFTLDEKGYEICNVRELIQPAAPSDLSVDSVYLYGEKYTFSLMGNAENSSVSAGMYFGDAGKWERNYGQWMKIIEDNRLDSHETHTVDGVTTETYVYTTKSAQIKRVFLTLPQETEGDSTRIVLKYVLQADNDPSRVSDTVPSEVFIFGEKNGIPFDYVIQGLTETPTVEWLSAFTIAPYGDSADDVSH